MKELSLKGNKPILFPFEPTEYWQNIRQIIREEVAKIEKDLPKGNILEMLGLTYKPLLKDHGVYPVPGYQTYHLQLDQSRKIETSKSKVKGLFPVPGCSKAHEYGIPGHAYLNLSFSPAHY
jgi:hypothetical protein